MQTSARSHVTGLLGSISARSLALIVGWSAASLLRSANGQSPLKETPRSRVGYATVAEAMSDLRSRPEITWRTINNWPVAVDEAAMAVFSFSPPDYPAYPAVVKRQVFAKGSGSTITMSVLCEASKTVCDDLVRMFADMNGLPTPEEQ